MYTKLLTNLKHKEPMTNWKSYRAENFCLAVTDGTHDSPKPQAEGRYLITSKHLKPTGIDFSSANKISEEDYQKIIQRSKVEQYDILFSMIGTIGNIHRVTMPTIDFAVKNMGIFKMGGDADKSLWMYYWLQSPIAKEYIQSRITGSTQGYLTLGNLRDFPVSVPPLEEQRRIAGILGAIDDKIECNRRINANLESQAQALYKQWFVDKRRDDWRTYKLNDITLHITDGVHNTVKDSPNGEYYLLSCKNIKKGTLSIGNNERRIDADTFARLRKRTQLAQGDILVTSVGTVGEMFLINESPMNYEFQRSVAIIKPNQDIVSSYFLYATLLYQQNEIKHLAHGAVQQCIFISDLKEYSLLLPNKKEISAFDSVVAPVFEKITKLQRENIELAALRDTLLPKLMNGEIKTDE